jgi:nicotinamide mononucleotide transporter
VSAWIEYFAVATGIGYALLAVRRIRWAWVFGGISSALLAWLAARSALPLQSALQTIYVGMAVYGFWQWSARKTEADPHDQRLEDSRKGPVIRRWPLRGHVLALVGIAAASLVLSPALAETTGASWPRLDAAVTCASLLATWMTARSVLENWLYWFAVNAVSIFLYGVQGLSLVAGLYVVYFVIAVFGWREWLAQYRRQ